MNHLQCLLAAAEPAVRTTFEWGRIQSNSDWILPLAAAVGLMLIVHWIYRRDAGELPRALGAMLTACRWLVFFGLLVLWLRPQWRTEQEQVIPSRALLLVDTSMSMGIQDEPLAGTSGSGSAPPSASRIDQVRAALEQSPLVDLLRRVHEVQVWQFDEQLHRDRVLSLARRPAASAAALGAPEAPASPGKGSRSSASAAPAADASADKPDSAAGQGAGEEEEQAAEQAVQWKEVLKLSGQETRLGQALRTLLEQATGQPVAGVILISDGGQNAGLSPEAAIELAREREVPVFTIGIGSDRLPPSVRVAAFDPPPRALPGDPYTVTGVIQAWRMAGQVVRVELLARDAPANSPADRGTGRLIDRTQVTLGADGEEVPVRFEITPDKLGRQTLVLRVAAPPSDRREEDNFLEADIEIVDRKTRVLLFAGGPMREYQFLRNLLYRDRSITVDVLLQTARPGISQESDRLLDEFPATREEMYEYDCLVAFDPDWKALGPMQIDVLESWVAEQGGGLILVAGPVYMGDPVRGWIRDRAADEQNPALAKVRALYPVEFQRRYAVLEESMYSSEECWPLEFSREGLESDFIMPADSPTEGRQIWAAFPGVFSFFPVRGPKEGATVLARFSDPRTARDGQLPVYMAWQFYGSGRVFYLGSGEMWRLRAMDEGYFEKFYTKLIRHISKGRLLRGSSRGLLLVGQERCWVGNTVQVEAFRLTGAQLKPLAEPAVPLQVIRPDQSVETISLHADPTRPGCYLGQFAVLQEGDYRLEVPLPGSDEHRLVQRIRVAIPDLEREQPQRNDALLSTIASATGGQYEVGVETLLDETSVRRLASQLKDCTRTVVHTGTPNPLWEETWRKWLMYTLCGLLCLEWVVRRLAKLA